MAEKNNLITAKCNRNKSKSKYEILNKKLLQQQENKTKKMKELIECTNNPLYQNNKELKEKIDESLLTYFETEVNDILFLTNIMKYEKKQSLTNNNEIPTEYVICEIMEKMMNDGNDYLDGALEETKNMVKEKGTNIKPKKTNK